MLSQSWVFCGEGLLTDREREVLLWAAAGKTSSETSQILGLTDGDEEEILIRLIDEFLALKA